MVFINTVSGVKTKYFNCNETAHAYPLCKTHKIKPDELATTDASSVELLLSGGKNNNLSCYGCCSLYLLNVPDVQGQYHNLNRSLVK